MDGNPNYFLILTGSIALLAGGLAWAIFIVASHRRELATRIKTEKVLRASEEKYRSLVESIDDAVYLIDRNMRYRYANKKYLSRLGISSAELEGQEYEKFHPHEATRMFGQKIDQVIASGQPTVYEHQSHRDNRYFLRTLSPVLDSKGEEIRVVTVSAIDITERKQAEERSEIFRTFTDNAIFGLAIADMDGLITHVNNYFATIHGYSIDEMIGKPFAICHTKEQLEEVTKVNQELLVTGRFEFQEIWHQHKNGSVFPTLMSGSVIKDKSGKPIHMVATAIDITERKQAEEEISMLSKFPSENPNPVIRVAKDGIIIYANAGSALWLDNWGCEVGDPLPEEFCNLTSKVSVSGTQEQTEVICGERMFSMTLAPIRNSDYVNLYGLDITKREQTEEELRQYERIVSSSSDMLALINTDFVYLAANAKYLAANKKNPEEVIGHAVSDVLGKEFFNAVIKPNAERCLAGEAVNFETSVDLPAYGSRHLDINYYPYFGVNDEIKGFVVNARDITDRKQAEEQITESREQLRELSRHLQSIREEERTEIAREIHDELGQHLTALIMDLSWVKNKLRRDQDPLKIKAGAMLELINSMIQTVKKLAARLRPAILDDLGIVAALEWEADEFCKHSDISCQLNFEPEEITLEPERSTTIYRIFQEALTNIVRHAKATTIIASLKLLADEVRLEITDNGTGISDKQVTGSKSFGLIGMRERAMQFGGNVAIEGRAGAGTRIIVQIPL